MKITVTKHSKDGLATVQYVGRVKEGTSWDGAKELADKMLDHAGAVLNTRYKAIRAKEKAKQRGE